MNAMHLPSGGSLWGSWQDCCDKLVLILRLNPLVRDLGAVLCFDLAALARCYRNGACSKGTIADDAVKILRLFVIFGMEKRIVIIACLLTVTLSLENGSSQDSEMIVFIEDQA